MPLMRGFPRFSDVECAERFMLLNADSLSPTVSHLLSFANLFHLILYNDFNNSIYNLCVRLWVVLYGVEINNINNLTRMNCIVKQPK